jgi:hypothetical protein
MDPIDRLTERHRELESVQPIYFLQRAIAEYDTPGCDTPTQVSMVGRSPKGIRSFTFIWVDNERYRVSIEPLHREPEEQRERQGEESEYAWGCFCELPNCMAEHREVPDGFQCRKAKALSKPGLGPPWRQEE